ncbi:MAG: hypothetical protein PHG48_07230 [Eubacteriales bacterium]|nr:hypothetical protein [Eubacteriales bacterium]
MNAQEVKALAKEYGADLVGIAPLERYEAMPVGFHFSWPKIRAA